MGEKDLPRVPFLKEDDPYAYERGWQVLAKDVLNRYNLSKPKGYFSPPSAEEKLLGSAEEYPTMFECLVCGCNCSFIKYNKEHGTWLECLREYKDGFYSTAVIPAGIYR